jgi:hypothetical protein
MERPRYGNLRLMRGDMYKLLYLLEIYSFIVVQFLYFQNFEHIECEWPIFYLFLIIDGVFKAIPEQVEEYCERAKKMLKRDARGGRKKFNMFLIMSIPGSRPRLQSRY